MSKDDGAQVMPDDGLFDLGGQMASDLAEPRFDNSMAFLADDSLAFAPADHSVGNPGHDDWMM